jgi:hypothetical protein
MRRGLAIPREYLSIADITMRELAPSCCASYDLARLVDGVQPLHHRRAVDSVLDKCFWLPADVDPANSIPAV